MRGAKRKEMFEISDLRREILHLRSVCLGEWGGGGECILIFSCIFISDLRREILHLRSVCLGGGGGGGGCTLIFSCIRRLGLFWGFKNLNFNIFGGFRKLNILGGGGGMKILWIFFGVITMQFRVFSESQGTKWRILFGLLKFQIFIWGA